MLVVYPQQQWSLPSWESFPLQVNRWDIGSSTPVACLKEMFMFVKISSSGSKCLIVYDQALIEQWSLCKCILYTHTHTHTHIHTHHPSLHTHTLTHSHTHRPASLVWARTRVSSPTTLGIRWSSSTTPLSLSPSLHRLIQTQVRHYHTEWLWALVSRCGWSSVTGALPQRNAWMGKLP